MACTTVLPFPLPLASALPFMDNSRPGYKEQAIF